MKLMDLFKTVLGKQPKTTECINCEHDKPAAQAPIAESETCSADGSCCDETSGDCCKGDSCQH